MIELTACVKSADIPMLNSKGWGRGQVEVKESLHCTRVCWRGREGGQMECPEYRGFLAMGVKQH